MKVLKCYTSSRTLGVGCLFLLMPLLCWGQGSSAGSRNLSEPAGGQLKLDLIQAQALLPAVADLATRERLNGLLSDAQDQVSDLHQNRSASDKAIKPAPVSAYQIVQLLKGLRAETFDEGKVAYIQQISKTHYFTAAQARPLLAAFAFDEGRADAAAALYPHIVDPDNFPAILNVFTFDDGRDETCKRLNL